jgi:transposase InsO family protein
LEGILGCGKRQIQILIKRGEIPRPDIPAQVGHPAHGGKGHGWYEENLLTSSSKIYQERILAKITTDQSQAVACIPRGQVVLAREGNSSLSAVQHEVEIISVPRAHEHSGKERKRFAQRLEVLSFFRPDDSLKEKKNLVRLYKADHPDARVSLRSALRWEAALREVGPEGLYDNYGGGIYSSVSDEVYEAWKKLYLVQQRPGAQVCRDLLEAEYSEIPSADALLRRLRKEMSPGDICFHRFGPKIHNRKFASFIDRDKKTVKPCQLWNLDHAQIDVAVRLPDGRLVFPWLTDCQDVASGKVLAYTLGGQPNAETIRLTFCRAVLRFGLPLEILIDNGKDFKAKTLTGGRKRFRLEMDIEQTKSLMFQIGVIVHFTDFYAAQSKPVERWHRTAKDRFSRSFRAFRGGNVQERPEELRAIVKSGSVLSLDEFEKRFAGWVEADYNNRGSRGKEMNGRTPNEVFAEDNVARPVDENSLSLLLLKSSRPVKVGRNGVTHLDRVYFAEPLLRIKGEEVYLRYDPGEMGRLWVYNMADQFVCQVTERERIPWNADEATLSEAIKQKRHENKVIADADKIRDDRSREPDRLKAFIAKKAQEHSTDLSPDTLYPERPLLRAFRGKVVQKDEEVRAEEERRREDQKDLIDRLDRDLGEAEKKRQLKEERRNEDLSKLLAYHDAEEKKPQEPTREFSREQFGPIWD